MLRGIYLTVLHADLKVPTIREEITKFSGKYRDKITTHRDELASTLLEEEEGGGGGEEEEDNDDD